MKSQQSEIRTNCKECVFAEFDNNIQLPHCKANRLEKFIDLNAHIKYKDDTKEWFCLKRFCNMYRNQDVSLEKAKNQIKTTFGIAIYDYENISNIEKSIKSIKNINYDKSKIKLVITSGHNDNASYLFTYTKALNEIKIKTKLIINFEKTNIDHEAFINLKNCAYLIKMNHDDQINPEMLEAIDNSLNSNLEKIIFFESSEIAAIPFWYANNEYLNFNDYNLLLSHAKQVAINSNMYKNI
jgi:hypothetical protein